ncbi:heme ABC exporter ATP-binding protein CcmA [Pelagibacteraceae bacterium]|nr:heme ABC exporter ATP-binding protein CcmA [Pelagibacteraceae bacterium]
MLLVQNISFERAKRKILSDVSLSLGSNKIIIIKGKNGSGKTTFLKIILNLIKHTSGSIYWKGKLLTTNLYDYYSNLTYIGDQTSSIRQLTINENIKIWKKIFLSKIDDTQIEKLLKTLNLINIIDYKVSSLSLGEKKKLELMRLIIEEKKIWLLDEPFTNLDSESIQVLSQTFEDHSNKGGSVLFSSHQDPEINISEEILL